MSRSFRALAAAIVCAALLLAPAASAEVGSTLKNAEREASVPAIIDAILLRPVGLVVTVMGAAVFAVPVAPLVLITRPTDIGKPFQRLVVDPARYTFIDPLGSHPQH